MIGENPETISSHISELCKEQNSVSPIEFLVRLMSGHDPRLKSRVKELADKIRKDRGTCIPTRKQWTDLCKVIDRDYSSKPVPLSQSTSAATQLMSYEHAKRKAVETKDTTPVQTISDKPLTKREIADLRKTFDLHF